MVKLNKIYTRTGDDGTTGLVGGVRIKKHALRVEAYGTVDEANAQLGQLRAALAEQPAPRGHVFAQIDQKLRRIQHDLFDLGADLATPYAEENDTALRIVPTQTSWLEQEIDGLNEQLAPLNSFVLPGGSLQSAAAHVARTVTRRAERLVSALSEEEKTNEEALKYLNRLSDYLFVLARTLNGNGERDLLWEPGVNR